MEGRRAVAAMLFAWAMTRSLACRTYEPKSRATFRPWRSRNRARPRPRNQNDWRWRWTISRSTVVSVPTICCACTCSNETDIACTSAAACVLQIGGGSSLYLVAAGGRATVCSVNLGDGRRPEPVDVVMMIEGGLHVQEIDHHRDDPHDPPGGGGRSPGGPTPPPGPGRGLA